MRFTVVTILPELIEPSLSAGVVGRAREAGTIAVHTVNPRDFTTDRHRTVDDTPYGGGPGMVMKAEPLLAAIERAASGPPPGSIVDADAPSHAPHRNAPLTDPDLVDVPSEPIRRGDDDIGRDQLPGAPHDIMTTGRFDRLSLRDSADDISTTGVFERDALLEGLESDDIATTGRFQRPAKGTGAATTNEALDSAIRQGTIDAALASVDASVRKIESMLPSATPPVTPPVAAEPAKKAHRILLSPSGKPLTQARVRELAKLEHLVLVCGRYEGVDQRLIDLAIDEELSIGDYVLSGGELGALVIIDAVSRYVPGVLGEASSVDDESFSAGLLEYPQYTRPPDLQGKTIPPVLLSGNHASINAWRKQQAMQRTVARRTDLWRSFRSTKADDKLVPPLRARTHLALVHHPVVDRTGAVVTTSLTNFDIHDLARSSMTFGIAGYHIVTPVTAHREKAQHIFELWSKDEQGEYRASALRLVRTAESIETVIASLTAEHGGTAPLVVATSAKSTSFPTAERRTTSELIAEATLNPAPLLILLGTGWGLADPLIPSVSRILAPIEGASDWNHLSVRSAGAVILDRLFGRPA